MPSVVLPVAPEEMQRAFQNLFEALLEWRALLVLLQSVSREFIHKTLKQKNLNLCGKD